MPVMEFYRLEKEIWAQGQYAYRKHIDDWWATVLGRNPIQSFQSKEHLEDFFLVADNCLAGNCDEKVQV